MINVRWEWVCDICGRVVTVKEGDIGHKVEETVPEPKGWDIWFAIPQDKRVKQNIDICDACPKCQKNPDWERYKEREEKR